MLSDIRFALRQLAKSPGFAVVTILSLGLGIGATTAIFSLVNAFLLRPLPVKAPHELILFRSLDGVGGRLSRGNEGNGFTDPATGRFAGTSFSLAVFERFRAQRSVLSEVFAFAPFPQPNVVVDGEPEVAVTAQLISGDYHRGLGVSFALGRAFGPEDDQPSAPPVAVISHRFWQRRFGGDPGVLGKIIQFNKVATAIIGVTAEGFAGAAQAGEYLDLSVPLAHHLTFRPGSEFRTQPAYWWVRIMGRLAPGATPAQVRAAFEPVFLETAREGWLAAQASDTTPRVMPDAPQLVAGSGDQGESETRRVQAQPLRLLLGLVSLVLFSACANVANLLLARGVARRREFALRLALGASRARVVRQLLVEALLLGMSGAALGTLLAYWGRSLLLAARPLGDAAVGLELPLDGRVLGFASAVAVATALAFGLAPALRATRIALATEFQGGARTLGRRSSRLSQGLMVAQIALSLVLLVSTGLFVRTLRNLGDVNAGFNTSHLALFRIDAASAGYPRERFAELHLRLRERFERIAGVQAATFSRLALLSRDRQSNTLSVPGSVREGDAPQSVDMNGVAPGFFAVTELPLLLGREFTERDKSGAPLVGIVNQKLARHYFGDENPMGRQVALSYSPSDRRLIEIVGVVGDAKYRDLRLPIEPTLYIPALQQTGGRVNFTLRAGGNPAALFPAIRAAVHEIDPTLPVLNLRTQEEQLARNHAQELLFARFSGFFGTLSLLLACIGLYGLMSYAVLQRTGEIGLRMALGAVPGQVLRMIVRESLTLVAIGIALGIAASYAAGRLVAAMLFGLSPTDPLTYGAVALVLVGFAIVASLLPARRAARVDPMVALRSE